MLFLLDLSFIYRIAEMILKIVFIIFLLFVNSDLFRFFYFIRNVWSFA